MGDEERHPLLAHASEDRIWDSLEQNQQGTASNQNIDLEKLIRDTPNEAIDVLAKRGMRKVAEFELPDSLIFNGQLGDDSIATFGNDDDFLEDYEGQWRRELSSFKGGKKKVKEDAWHSLVPVIAYVVAIEDALDPERGVLHRLLLRWQAGKCGYSVFALPALQAIIDFKWTKFARKLLLTEFAFFMLWLVSFYSFTIAFQDEDASLSFAQLLQTSRGKISILCNILSLIGMAPFLAIEVGTLKAYGLFGWATAWNLLDTATYGIQLVIVVMHFGRINVASGSLSIAAALQAILMLFRLQFFSRVMPNTHFALVDQLREVIASVQYYLIFLIIIILGYATSFHILFRYDQESHEEFATFGSSFIQMVGWAFGGPELPSLYAGDVRNPFTACLLGVSFAFIMGLVLMNLLIGLMTNCLDKVTSKQDVKSLLSKAQIIDELESTIPYQAFDAFPKYVHVLRVDPDKIDSATFNAIWAGEQYDAFQTYNKVEDANSDEQGKASSMTSDKELRLQIELMRNELKELKDMISQLVSQKE